MSIGNSLCKRTLWQEQSKGWLDNYKLCMFYSDLEWEAFNHGDREPKSI